MANTNKKQKREKIRKMVFVFLSERSHGINVRDLTKLISENTRYEITPVQLGALLRPLVIRGEIEKIVDSESSPFYRIKTIK